MRDEVVLLVPTRTDFPNGAGVLEKRVETGALKVYVHTNLPVTTSIQTHYIQTSRTTLRDAKQQPGVLGTVAGTK